MTTERFAHLHVHSDYSQLDGACTVARYVDEAVARGNPGLSMTEHGSMRSIFELYTRTRGKDIRPVFGVEFYFAPDRNRKGLTDVERERYLSGLTKKELRDRQREVERSLGIRSPFHLTAWAETERGLKNLFSLSTKAYTDGFYMKPRVDLELLEEHSEGVILGTACVGGFPGRAAMAGNVREAFRLLERLSGIFPGRVYCEIMPHAIPEQVAANRVTELLSRKFKLPLLATADAHYLRAEDKDFHEVILAIGTHAVMSDPNRFTFPGGTYHFRTRAEMEQGFREHHPELSEKAIRRALDHTVEVVERCGFTLDLGAAKALLPRPRMKAPSELEELMRLTREGWTWRDIPGRAQRLAKRRGKDEAKTYRQYVERLTYEMRVIAGHRFIRYFLLVRDLYQWVRKKGIQFGPGRGSAAGSLVSFLLGITSVDPMEHGLLFERFISPGRVDLPDVDCDFEDVRRGEILGYLERRYGEDHVCRVTTFGTLSARQVLKDVCRVFEVPFRESNRLTATIPADVGLSEACETVPACVEFAASRPEIFLHAKSVEGMVKSLGVHAAGVVVSPVPLHKVIPVETREYKGQRVRVSSIDKDALQSFGLVKLDILGLRTLTLIRRAKEEIKRRHGVEIDLEALDLDDPEVLRHFSEQDFVEVFQFDTPTMERTAHGVTFGAFSDIAILNAINRPGTQRSGLTQEYLERRKDPAKIRWAAMHPIVRKITKDTLGIIIYQEQAMRIIHELGGFSPSETDEVRKKIAKSKGREELEAIRERFVRGAIERGMDPSQANKLMDNLAEFGGYAFNLAHAVVYSVIAVWTQYLKIRFPTEFFWACLVTEPDLDRIRYITQHAKRRGVEFLPVDLNHSRSEFSIDKDGIIRGSLSDIKFVGETSTDEIMALRPFKGLEDFIRRTSPRRVNKRVVLSLAKAGAFDSLVPNVRAFLDRFEDRVWPAWRLRDFESLQAALTEEHPTYTELERSQVALTVTPLVFGAHPLDEWIPFIEANVKVEVSSFDAPKMFDTGGGRWFWGWVIRLETEEKTGATFAVVEGASGLGKRFKVGEEFNPKLVNAPVIVFCKVDSSRQMIRPCIWLPLERYRSILARGKRPKGFLGLLTGWHPALTFAWKKAATREAVGVDLEAKLERTHLGGKFDATGLVMSVNRIKDKRGRDMAFLGLLGVKGFLEVVCFADDWDKLRGTVGAGELITLRVRRESQGCSFGGNVWRHKE